MSQPLRTFAHPAGVHNATPPRVVFGPGSIAGLRDEVARLGARRALVVTTPGRVELGKHAASILGDRCVDVLPDAVTQVPIEHARRGRRTAAELGADCLVAVGGGAATGLCKGIAFESGLPIVAVPTTYSGSEMTGFCGMTVDGVKRMHESLAMRPSVVVYDAELSRTLPPAVSAASAMNALAHCIDAVYLPSLSPLLLPAAVEGARLVTTTLPALLADPGDLWVRNEMLYAAYLSGAALTGGFGLQHEVAHALGGSYGVDHGIAHAVVLPYVTDHLVRHAPTPFVEVADALDVGDLAGHVWDLAAQAGLPTRLSDVGVGRDEVERVVAIAAAGDGGGAATSPEAHDPGRPGNPVPVSETAVRAVVAAAVDGRRPGAQ